MVITIILFRHRDRAGTLYAFDLAGAAAGSLIVIFLLYRFSGPAIIFGASAFAFLAAAAFSTDRRRFAPLLFALAAFALLLVNDRTGLLTVRAIKSYATLAGQKGEGRKLFEKWSPVSRVAVFPPIQGEYGEWMRVTNDAGAPTVLYRASRETVASLVRHPQQIVYRLRKGADALIIGSAGGSDVMVALATGQRHVTAVEINPVIGELVTRRFADYIGHVFHHPRVDFHVQEGRNFAAGTSKKFDIIKITMIDSWAGAAAGAYIFNENTLYTYEALEDYYDHLKPNGIISVTRYYRWDEALRWTNTCVEFMRRNGIQKPEQRLIVVREQTRGYRRATVLLKKGLFTSGEIARIVAASQAKHVSIIHAPGVPRQMLDPSSESRAYRLLINGSDDERNAFVRNYPRVIEPSTDDKPFFFFMDRFGAMFDRKEQDEHPARLLAIPMLYLMLAFFGIVALCTILLPLVIYKRRALQGKRLLVDMAYFAAIGVGFMLVEISLIHRLTVFLGQPAYSFVVVLSSLLLFAGIGSAVSGFLSIRSGLPSVLALIVAAIVLYGIFTYDALIELMWLSVTARIATAVALIAPIGFGLGMCFPLAIRQLSRLHEEAIPWAWGINGAFSVFASALSLVIALNLGLKTMLFTGAVCYAAALLVALRWRRGHAGGGDRHEAYEPAPL